MVSSTASLGRSFGGPLASQSAHQKLVDGVKAFQKTSQEARLQWRGYCDALGGGTRDPSRHSAEFLREFFVFQQQSLLPQVEAPLHERPLPEVDSAAEESRAVLEARVRYGLNRSKNFRAAWLQLLGPGMEPAAIDALTLLRFLRAAEADPRTSLTKDPYAKPPSCCSPLAKCIKEMQSSKLTWKRQWDALCDAEGCGARDPARHPPCFLQRFLEVAKPPCPDALLLKYGLQPSVAECKASDDSASVTTDGEESVSSGGSHSAQSTSSSRRATSLPPRRRAVCGDLMERRYQPLGVRVKNTFIEVPVEVPECWQL